ncbi:DNA-directed RNA polymerase II subunit RPB11-like [Zophobas morio]|uniref:DNA-directed RNA polymerase II subunit RPB11-like n=1 Tax=Zophobas morio TaxID=2755281 RepID=UPI003083DD66
MGGLNQPEPSESFLLGEGEKKITFEMDTKVLSAATFTIKKEDHTLGNLLREQLLKDDQVIFSGYKNPHPLQHEIILRVQTHHGESYSPVDALQNAINHLLVDIEILENQFQDEVDKKKEVNKRFML